MTKRVVLLNGPPGSGKDAIGSTCKTLYNAHTAEFKDVLYQHTADLFNLPVERFKVFATNRVTKEMPLEKLQGYSPRQALIFTSEEVYKKIYGKGYFGKITADSLKEGITFITDAGFIEEAQEIIEVIGADNVLHLKLYREGCSFEGDSRSYYDLTDQGVTSNALGNNSSIGRAVTNVHTILKQKGWVE